ncbi:reverse transcriptase domain-containing protein [Streptomyces sp. NPDC055078]
MDGQSIEDFEKGLKNNLYKVWNRMSSGSYFPPPVRAVEIPKPHGDGTRMLGIPAVADRVAQTVVARHLMRRVDPIFHPDSYGYRPGRSALDAVERCRERCWKRDWVVEFDITKFFDSVPWDLLVKAVEAHTDAVWVKLYVRRWLHAPLAMPDGSLLERECGTPQGAPVSPVLANLFLHYAFDTWMAREFPNIWFERYADDAVLHCVTERQARQVLAALMDRMAEVGLQLHPAKTRLVYCKDGRRRVCAEPPPRENSRRPPRPTASPRSPAPYWPAWPPCPATVPTGPNCWTRPVTRPGPGPHSPSLAPRPGPDRGDEVARPAPERGGPRTPSAHAAVPLLILVVEKVAGGVDRSYSSGVGTRKAPNSRKGKALWDASRSARRTAPTSNCTTRTRAPGSRLC